MHTSANPYSSSSSALVALRLLRSLRWAFFPLSLAPCTSSTKAPLFYVSLDNGSDLLTLALT